MSDTEDKPTRTRKPLGLSRAVDAGEVKQTFSHGRTNKVTVEVKRRRKLVKPGEAQPAQETAAEPAPAPTPAPVPKVAPKPAAKKASASAETAQERVARLQREAEEDRLRSAEEARRREEDEKAKALSEEKQRVKDAGGLFVLGTERHESRRIDNQLRGRSGRQGDPGLSRFYLCLEDDLLRIFGPDTLFSRMMNSNLEDGEAIGSKWLSKAIETAQ